MLRIQGTMNQELKKDLLSANDRILALETMLHDVQQNGMVQMIFGRMSRNNIINDTL
jgi:hypothetical protein